MIPAARVLGRAGVRALLAGVAVAALAGCGGSELLSPPTGVDQLVIPTPSPRPADFVERIDNPWLAWRPGSSTTYRQSGSTGAVVEEVTVTVSATPTPVAGLAATVLTTSWTGGRQTVDWFAQDRDGNVWWLGRDGSWTAGQDGAQAGLWMPAAPRVGDGFRQGAAEDVSEDVATITLAPDEGSDEGSGDPSPSPSDGPSGASTSAGSTTEVQVRSVLDPGAVSIRTYVEGAGLVRDLRSGPDGYLRTVVPD